MKVSDPKEKGIQYPLKNLIQDIWHYSGDKKKHLIAGVFFRALGDIAGLVPAYILALIVSGLTTHIYSLQKLYILALLAGVTYVVRHVSNYIAKRFIYNVAQKVYLESEKNMLQILMSKDSAWHEKESTGVKIKRIERGSFSYKEVLYAFINYYIEVIVTFIGMPLILQKFDSKIALLMVVFVVGYFVISKSLQKKCIIAAHNVNVAEDKLNGEVYETISNIRTVRVLNISEEMSKNVSEYMKTMLSALKKRIHAFQSRNSIMAIIANLFKVGVILYIIYLVFYGYYEVGFIVLFSVYFDKIWENIRELTDVSQDVIVSRQSISRMYELVGKEVTQEKGTELFPKEWGALSVENLTFSYGDNQALSNISFSIKQGEKVGIVGLSGAGKSTLFKLLVRERSDYTGKIKIGDTLIQDIKTDEFYKNVSIVPQDTEVFNFSLKDNITISQPLKAGDEALLERSLAISHVKDFLTKMKDGVNTLIGEKGIKLSGGERQRLGIARAIFKEPEILLLDEATSHLDLESEEKIKDSLHIFFENVTAIVIAHRLTTIREMDTILVIEEGGILEEGSFEDLMEKKGRFYELWQKQLL